MPGQILVGGCRDDHQRHLRGQLAQATRQIETIHAREVEVHHGRGQRGPAGRRIIQGRDRHPHLAFMQLQALEQGLGRQVQAGREGRDLKPQLQSAGNVLVVVDQGHGAVGQPLFQGG